jgi:hypothetical protein
MRMNYYCGAGGGGDPSGGFLLGDPRRKGGTWTVYYGRDVKHAASYRRVEIVSAWW